MLRWEAGGDAERHAFMQMATGYVAGYREHMRLEESELMPLAERTLSARDWVDVEAAFASHTDPLAGPTRRPTPTSCSAASSTSRRRPSGWGRRRGVGR